MHRLADRLVNRLLRIAPWYRPEAIEAREAHTERVRRMSVAIRTKDVEPILGSYQRTRIGH